MRKVDALEHFDVSAFAAGHHGGNEVSGAVVAEAGRSLPGRAVIGTGNVGDVVLDVVLLKAKLRGVGVEGSGKEGANVAHGFLALAKPDKVQNLRRPGQSILHFFRKIGVAVLSDGHVIDVADFRSNRVETR